jgi:hypothetical protein
VDGEVDVSQPPAVPEGADIDMLAAALRADVADLDVYARVLTNSLAAALPEGMVLIERDPSLRDRLAGRPGSVTSIRLDFGELGLELRPRRGGEPSARAVRVVRNVVISTRDIGLDEWSRLLAENLAQRASESAAARQALGRLMG